MIGIAKIDYINDKVPEKFEQEYIKDFKGKIHKKGEKKIIKTYYCKEGDKLGIISSNEYVNKLGSYFFTVINERNEVFYLDENEVNVPINFKNVEYKLVTKTTILKYKDFVEKEEQGFDFGF